MDHHRAAKPTRSAKEQLYQQYYPRIPHSAQHSEIHARDPDQFWRNGGPGKTARYLKINQGIIEKLEQNADRVLEITQFESGVRLAKKDTVNIDALIRGIVERFTVIDKVAITLINDAGLTDVQSDGYVIDTVITNLVDNAIKYAGGKVNIAIQIAASTDGWQLTVGDDGSGIAQRYLPFIFDKFYRVPSGDLHDVKGYGLGLSYVQQLVASLGGKIEVRSELKAGTTFIIKFPNG